MTVIAVYGTLRKGNHNHYLLEKATFLGEGLTVQPFTMYTGGGFPALTADLKGTNIVVELYEVTDRELSDVNRLEGYPGWYEREEVVVQLQDSSIAALIYTMETPMTDRIVVSGDWMNREDIRRVV